MRSIMIFSVCAVSMLAGCTPKGPEPEKPGSVATEQPAQPQSETASKTETKPAASATPKPADPKPAAAKPADVKPAIVETPVDKDVVNPVLASKLLTEEQVADGWLALFDGHSLFGWRSSAEDINWSVIDGVLTADSGANGVLLTEVPFADYELVCEFRAAENCNSGVFLRSVPHPTFTPKALVEDFYEVNIADTQPDGYLTGSLVARARASEPILGSANGWNTLRIIANGRKITVEYNGKQVLDYTDETERFRAAGFIGVQKNVGKIEFKSVNLKPLNQAPLFDGATLNGWRVVPGSKSTFKVEDGKILVKDGPGFLETESTWQNYLFQTQVITNAKDLNSGFFFRAAQGTDAAPSNGYEVQVHNGLKNGERTKPDNAGTGAIFRRVDARRVVSDDNKWCSITLVNSGPQIAVWVDGYQVVNWQDTRSEDENPRKGLRLNAGHFSLQGHDPATDVEFRAITISDLGKAQ